MAEKLKKPAKKVKKNASEAHKKVAKESKFEDRLDLKKLFLYTIIVPRGQGGNVIRILRTNHSSAQFYQMGEGTASSKIREILDIEDTKKDIVYSIVSGEAVKEIKRELDAYFIASKRNRGIAYTIPLTALVGVKMYKFLTQTVRG